jgi:hypothetical protein
VISQNKGNLYFMADKKGADGKTAEQKGTEDTPVEERPSEEPVSDGAGSRERVIQVTQTGKSAVQELAKSLISSDRVARRMAFFFFFSVIGVVVVIYGLAKNFSEKSAQRSFQESGFQDIGVVEDKTLLELQRLREGLGGSKKEDEIIDEYAVFSFGKFLIDIQLAPGERMTPGMVNMAEIEIVVQCNRESACKYLKENQVRARDQLVPVFTNIYREDLLSLAGKNELKKAIIQALNEWFPEGFHALDVFFSQLLIGESVVDPESYAV